MQRTFLALGVALLVLTAAVAPASAQLLDGDDDTPGLVEYDAGPSFIIEVSDSDDLDTLEDWADSGDDRTLVNRNNDTNTATVAAPRDSIQGNRIARLLGLSQSLAARGYVEAIDPNYEIELAQPIDDPLNESDYDAPTRGLIAREPIDTDSIAFDEDAENMPVGTAANKTEADTVSAVGDGVTVAVVDTGANTADGRVFGNGTAGSDIRVDNASKNFITNESVNATDSDFAAVEDDNSHGTHVAATVLANHSNPKYDGVAPNATLLALKALDEGGSGSTADIRRAIRYAADEGADVIALSLGSPVWSEPIVDAVEYARDEGAVVSIAAGNSRQTRSPGIGTPGDVQLDGVITVAATNATRAETAGVGYFSQFGPDPGTTDNSGGESAGAAVDVAAPGMNIVVKTATEDGRVINDSKTGTSMAQPYVAGTAALVIADDGSLEPAEVTERITDGARPMPNAATATAGAGYLSVGNALNASAPDTDQADAMTTEAAARDEFYRARSDSAGGLVTRLFN